MLFLFNTEMLRTVFPYALPFVVIPFLLWLAFRFEGITSTIGFIAVSLFAIYFTSQSKGPFHLFQLQGDSILLLQVYVVVISISTLVLAAAVHERQQAQSDLKKFVRLPAAVEERLGSDRQRNQALFESFRSLQHEVGRDWTAILFATSVDHARVMAALLNLEGIPSAAITAESDAGARRYYVEGFRKGTIRVLTNYGVLAQGFDAPSVRVIYVARPTFSPNLYQQMIGRGLRGPKNGGKERCLIVNVRDNLDRYGVQLAFHHFDHLWRGRQL